MAALSPATARSAKIVRSAETTLSAKTAFARVAMVVGCALAAGGCASPGPPHSPSLNLPRPVTDLSAQRIGDSVELHFTAPSRSTDKLPLRSATMQGVLCRAVEHQPCVAVAGFSTQTPIAVEGPNGGPNLVTWHDPLPVQLGSGPHRILSYQVEFFNASGQSAGKSDAAYTVSGDPPPPVEGLRADGSRSGIVLRWRPSLSASGPEPVAVLLERENLSAAALPGAAPTSGSASSAAARPANQKPGGARRAPAAAVVWLDSNSNGPSTGSGQSSTEPGSESPLIQTSSAAAEKTETLDTTAEPDVAYRYRAARRLTVSLGARSLSIRSVPSAAVEITLREIYAPPSPTGLVAAGDYAPGPEPAFSVDLVWQPVDEAGLLAGLAGYNVYRATVPATADAAAAPRTRLNNAPLKLPAFHDAAASPTLAYRYFVTALDSRGNESSPVSVDLQPSPAPPPAGPPAP